MVNDHGISEYPMPILNYTTTVAASKTAAEIVAILARHRATNIMMEYDGRGMVTGIKWRIETAHGPQAFGLPVNSKAVYDSMTRDRILASDKDRRMAQADRTAWRIIKDWVEAQMALIESGQVQMEQIFLPYMLVGQQTMYEVLAEGGFQDGLKSLPPAK